MEQPAKETTGGPEEPSVDTTFSSARDIPTESRAIAGIYDNLAPNYEVSVREWGYEAPDVVGRLIREHGVGLTEPILDSGCGTGMTGIAWNKLGYTNITGVDLSKDSLVKARATGAYVTVRSEPHDLNQPMPFFDDDRFAAVLCVGVLTYVPNLAPALKEFARVTRPGGFLVFTQRDDLYEQRREAAVLAQLCDAKILRKVYQSPASPYLPRHPDYGDKIKVFYFVYRVL